MSDISLSTGCFLNNSTGLFTGSALVRVMHLIYLLSLTVPESTTCNASVDNNAGCAIEEWSRASYGPYFDSQGGGVFALAWTEDEIALCEC